MTLSIIITSWNTRELLRAALRSIERFPSRYPSEVIVVDNDSRDRSAEMVESEFPAVRLIKNNVNTGYAGGNNIGYAASRGELILLLGSDTEVRHGSIDVMAEYLMQHPEAGAVCCRLERPDGSLQRSCKRFPTPMNAVATYCSLHFLNRTYLMSDFDHTTVREVDQPDATCIMLRRETIGGDRIFDERFTILYNDVDLCQRIKREGRTIVFLPEATVLHHGSQSTKQAPPELRLVMYRNILLYFQTYWGAYTRLFLTPILMVRYLAATRSLSAMKLLSIS